MGGRRSLQQLGLNVSAEKSCWLTGKSRGESKLLGRISAVFFLLQSARITKPKTWLVGLKMTTEALGRPDQTEGRGRRIQSQYFC